MPGDISVAAAFHSSGSSSRTQSALNTACEESRFAPTCRVELLRRHHLRERGGLLLGAAIHPDHGGAYRTPSGVADHHPVQLGPERQAL